MAAEPTDLSHLDIDTIETFVGTEVREFIDLLKILQEDKGTGEGAISAVRWLPDALAKVELGISTHMLRLGKLGKKEATPMSADGLVAYLKAAAADQKVVIDNQQKLFEDIERNMNTVLAKMKKNQADSLEKVTSQDFLNDLHNVDGDLAPTQKPA